MEIEVIHPVPLPPSSPDFSFDSSASTPYITAPSSPQRFAATAAAYTNYSTTAYATVDLSRTSFSINPALWEEDCPRLSGTTPGSPSDFIDFDDFEFEFGGSKSTPFNPSPADELFDHGRIKPLATVSRSPEPLSSSTVATASTATGAATGTVLPKRVCDILIEEDDGEDDEERPMAPAVSTPTSNSKTFSSLISSITNPKGYRKWSFRDFLLFRSASEGRGTSKDPLRKFQALGPKIMRSESVGESTRGSSSRANIVATTIGEESSIRKQKIGKGPHEAYYSANKAVAEEMKRRTALPYKQGLLGGCLGFNPNPGAHDLARGFGSISRG